MIAFLSAVVGVNQVDNKIVEPSSSTSVLLDVLRRKTGRTEPEWMDWDTDRGEEVPGQGMMATRCVEFNHKLNPTFSEHADCVANYAKDLQDLFGDVKLYYRMSGCWCMFVLAEQKHKARVIAINEAGLVTQLNAKDKYKRVICQEIK